ncbi:MAG: hypothetical protein BWY92_01634 [Firmicutes bacterium ADurb.BinA052]|jgi:hypothetical protein|nr:MAG: hypothetical protein BWY92_01634 [Firmicutes bacterium ADurb.BinA052]
MSIAETHAITCPKCRKTQEQEIWQSINVSIDGEMKERVRTGDINVFVCSNCGAERRIECPVLYHDMHGKLMIWSLPGAQSFEQLSAEDEQLRQVLGLGQSEYRKRVVRSMAQLAETVRIFDDGLDDRAIALIKAGHRRRRGLRINETVYFGIHEKRGEGKVLVFVDRSQKLYGSPLASYPRVQALVDKYAPPDNGSWIMVDREYARKILAAHRKDSGWRAGL